MADSDDRYYPTQFQIGSDGYFTSEHNYHKNQVYETKEDIMKKSSVESSKAEAKKYLMENKATNVEVVVVAEYFFEDTVQN